MRHVRKTTKRSRGRVGVMNQPVVMLRNVDSNVSYANPTNTVSTVIGENGEAMKKRAKNVVDALSSHFAIWQPEVVKKEA